jgi:polyhydroxyalkanoate synthesis regulator phasin
MRRLFIRFQYTELRNEVHVEYNETADGIVVKHNPQTLGILPQHSAFKTSLNLEVGVLDIINKSGYTGEISAQDSVRDSIFRGFDDAVKSAENHFNADKRKAAERIRVVLDHYGNIAAKSFDQETAAIDDLERELNDNYAADIQLLGLTDWLTQLDAENQKFKTLMSERYAETAKRPSTRMKAARSETDKALRALLDMVEALAAVNGADAYLPFINELNAVSERYKNQLAQAAGRRAKTKTEEEE